MGERGAPRRELHLASQRRAQLENESRKRELEHDRLKRRLSSLVSDKSREVVCGSIQIGGGDETVLTGRAPPTRRSYSGKAAALDEAARACAASVPSPAVSLELHHSMMSAYEAKLRAFMHDVADLKAMLRDAGVDPESGRATRRRPGRGPGR